MRTNRIIAAITSGALFLGSAAAFAQAERNQELLDQRQRDQQRGFPNGDPRSGDATTPAVTDRRGNLHEVRPTNNHGGYQVGPALSARSDPRHEQRYDPRYYQRYDNREGRYYPGDHNGGDWRGRGAGPNHDWYRGSRLPREYNSRYYVVDDWRGHHLSAPPRGYHWVQNGGDYVLAAIATGVIAAILLNQ
ncbi:MAG TPA: RcnB family protein [Caldimonas sp.]|jgi:Ni/Co efflux regulator RcnB